MITIDGKEYDETKFSSELRNYITARQEVVTSKTRLAIEMEKTDVLTKFYNDKIVELLKTESDGFQSAEKTEEQRNMAAIANLSVDQGATFTSDVTVKDANGNPFDLSGYTAQAKLAKGYNSVNTRVSFTTTVAADATTGIVSLQLSKTQTEALDDTRYVYDLEITQTSSGNVTRVIEGIITVRPQVSV